MPRFEQRHTDLAHGLFTVPTRGADAYGVGVAGGKGPLRRVVVDRNGPEPGRTAFLPHLAAFVLRKAAYCGVNATVLVCR